MKKLLITLSAIAVTMLGLTLTAEAGKRVKYLAGYDSCGRPVYCYKYVPTYSYCTPTYYQRTYHYHSPGIQPYSRSRIRSHSYRPSYHSHGRSYSRSYGFSFSRGRSYCR